MRRYWKGSDLRLDIVITDKEGQIVPLSSIESLVIYLTTSGEQYVEYSYPKDIMEDEDGIFIPINENALSYLPDGLLKWEAHFKIRDAEWDNGRDTVRSCETDIFVKTPRDFVPKQNVQQKEISLTENGDYEIVPDAGYEGISRLSITNDTHPKLKPSELGITFSNATFTEMPDVFDISDVTNFDYFFYGASKLTKVPEIQQPITSSRSMFEGCSSLASLPDDFDFEHTTNAAYMFYKCGIKEFREIDIPLATNMSHFFHDCSATSIGNINAPSTARVDEFFWNCKVVTLGDVYAPKASDTSWFFDNTSSLVTCGKITVAYFNNNMLYGTRNIENFGGFVGLAVSFDFSSLTKLTEQSLVNIMNEAATVTGVKVLTFGSVNLSKLTDEEKAIAINKGWTLA
jgi:hypothetical protein